MNPKVVIRDETHADVCAITEVTTAAFKTLEISNHTEQFIIEALRELESGGFQLAGRGRFLEGFRGRLELGEIRPLLRNVGNMAETLVGDH